MKLRYLLAAGLGVLLLSGCHQHTWIEADCVSPKHCESCGETIGEPLGHAWQDATCTEPKSCTRCGQTEGKPEGHSFSWTAVKPATCSEPGTEEGTCGEIAEEETYKLSPEEQEAYFKTTCQTFTYDEIARHPDDHMLEAAKFTGEVVQVVEDGDTVVMRLAITKGRYVWSDPILVRYSRTDSSEGRILEDDIITVYGVMMGTYTYTSTMGASITIPYLLCSYVDL